MTRLCYEDGDSCGDNDDDKDGNKDGDNDGENVTIQNIDLESLEKITNSGREEHPGIW